MQRENLAFIISTNLQKELMNTRAFNYACYIIKTHGKMENVHLVYKV